MQTVILAGGTGTRLKEMTEFLPKPLIPIGGVPMVVHIMKWYAKFGFDEFVLALGYKQEAFKEYFTHYGIINSDAIVDLRLGKVETNYHSDRFHIVLSDTGINTLKGARLKMVEKYVKGDTFMCTYGDGIGNIDIEELLNFHLNHGKICTVTGVHAPARFGEIHHDGGKVTSFSEKPINGDGLISGGFYVFNRKIFDYLSTDTTCDLETGALEMLAKKDEMRVYHHKGYWGCLDTLKEMNDLENLWNSGDAPWQIK